MKSAGMNGSFLANSNSIFSAKTTGGASARHGALEVFGELASRLRRIVELRTVQLTLCGSDECQVLLRMLDPPSAAETEDQAGASPAQAVCRNQEPMLVSVSNDVERFPKYTTWMKMIGLETEWVLPVTCEHRHLGALGLGLTEGRQFSHSDLNGFRSITQEYAIALRDVSSLQEAQWARGELARERDRSRLLLEINNALISHLDLHELWTKVAECLLRIVPHESSSIALYDRHGSMFRTIGSIGHEGGLFSEEYTPVQGSAAGLALQSGKPLVITPSDAHRFPKASLCNLVANKAFASACIIPLISHDRKLGVLELVSEREGAFGPENLIVLTGVAAQISIAIENALTHQEVECLKNRLHAEKRYLDEENQASCEFELIGNSECLRRILRQLEVVAPTDATILIQGETGTGKELIARAIHKLSGRSERTLVKVNCSAIPTGLLESEFFGHEKGAFTGAVARRMGRFELAHRGTLFLDEIGDIPRELQPKLLRVLQEKEFERVGGSKTIRVDLRLVAATNADLGQMVADKEFRSDLYYRLNVFPIKVPPLRERPEDIVPLAQRFAQNFARRMKKPVEVIPPHVQHALTEYQWPGNIRELQNVIERAVILSSGPVLEIPISESKPLAKEATLAGMEREYILRILRETNWLVSGSHGAANRLGLNRSTLQSKMRKLGISRPE